MKLNPDLYTPSLSSKAWNSLNGCFLDQGYTMNADTRMAMAAILGLFERCLKGDVEKEYFLASLDPGMGKTQAVVTFLREWKAQGFKPDGSVLIGLSTKEEIRTYIDRSGLSEADFAVLTSDEEYNQMGLSQRDHARVLITTQQMIVSRTRDGSFSDAGVFHYWGQPRSLRIWDESLVPAIPHVLRLDSLNGLAEPLRPIVPELVEMIESFVAEVRAKAVGSTIMIPQELASGITNSIAFSGMAWSQIRDEQRSLRNAIIAMAGRPMVILQDNLKGRMLVGCTQRLPHDFTPAVILDASGRVRGTYRLWETYLGGLRRLPDAANDYGRLDVHPWSQAASRSALEDAGTRRKVLRVVADLINGKPDEDWLIIHHTSLSTWLRRG